MPQRQYAEGWPDLSNSDHCGAQDKCAAHSSNKVSLPMDMEALLTFMLHSLLLHFCRIQRCNLLISIFIPACICAHLPVASKAVSALHMHTWSSELAKRMAVRGSQLPCIPDPEAC